MGVKEFYLSIEDKYYGLMEKIGLENLFVAPLESHGIPSFPIAVLLLLALAFGAWFVLAGAPGGVEFSVRVYGNEERLSGATVQVFDAQGNLVGELETENGIASLNLPPGVFTLKVKKAGFSEYEATVDTRDSALVRVDLYSAEIGIPTPTPQATLNPYAYESPSMESQTGSLNIIVRDEDNEPVSGDAKVYDAKTNVFIDSVEIEGGTGVLSNLELDMQVFVNFQTDGYYPYNGEGNVKVIQPGVNSYLIHVQSIVSNGTAPLETILRVMKSGDDAPIQGAEVNVYESDGLTPIYSQLITDSSGEVALTLADGYYYASADAKDYFRGFSSVFEAQDEVEFSLTPVEAETSVDLAVTVIDGEDGEPMAGAGVALFALYQNTWRPLADTQVTNAFGEASFPSLMRGLNVMIQVSKGSRSANTTVLLPNSAAEFSVTIEVPLNPATAVVEAFDLLSNQSINGVFQAYYNESLLDSCAAAAGQSCELSILARRDVTIQASSSGYASRLTVVNLPAETEEEIRIGLIPLDSLNDSYVAFDGFYNYLGQQTDSLMIGHDYEARFWIITQDADLSGLFFKVADENAIDAFITGVSPPPAIVKANYVPGPEFVDAQCNASTPCNWMEAQYAGSQNRLVTFDVSVSPTVEVDPETHKGEASFSYRSWIARGSTTIIRNPWDNILETAIDDLLASGYYANAYEINADIMSPGTTCIDGICVSMEFSQGDQVGPNEGFPAISLLNLAPGDAEWEPLVVHWQVELFRDLGAESYLSFTFEPENFQLDSGQLSVEDYTPESDDLVCGTFDSTQLEFEYYEEEDGTVVAIADVTALKKCTNYIPYSQSNISFTVTGEFYLKPLGSTDFTITETAFSTLQTQSAEIPNPFVTGFHQSWLSVENPNGAYTPYGSVELQLSQRENDAGQLEDPWEAVNIADCTDQEIQDESCHHGLVRLDMAFTAQRSRDSNEIMLQTIPAHLKIVSASYEKNGVTYYPQLYEQGFTASVGAMSIGETVTATAWAKPVGINTYSVVTVQHKSVDPAGGQGQPEAQHPTKLERSVFVSAIPTQGDSEFQEFGGLDGDCDGSVHVTFNPQLTGGAAFHLQAGCTQLAMMVTPVFPADAVPTFIESSGQLLGVQVLADDGSSGCYESCSADGSSCTAGFTALTDAGEHVLRYNPQAAPCPNEFKLAGNRIKSSSVLLGITPVGSDDQEELNITVYGNPLGSECYEAWLNGQTQEDCLSQYGDVTQDTEEPRYRYKSFYVGPVIKSYMLEPSPEGDQRDATDLASLSPVEYHPELWAIVNHKQTGPRSFIIVEASTVHPADPSASYDEIYPFNGLNPYFYANFDGPGVQTFAYYPQAGKRLIIYEQLANAVPVFVYDPCDSEEWESISGCSQQTSFASTYNKVYLTDAQPEYDEVFEEYSEENPLSDYFAGPDLPGLKPYSWPVLQAVVEKGRNAANWTSFWRSNSVTYWCDSSLGLDEYAFLNWTQCRPTVDDWRDIGVENVTQQHACIFCNNSYAPDNPLCDNLDSDYLQCTLNQLIPTTDCDERCFFTGEGVGAAFVEYGDSFISNYSECETRITTTMPYDGSEPMQSISKSVAQLCYSQAQSGDIPGCPLDFSAGTKGTSNPKPLCIMDGDYDGFRSGETEFTEAVLSGNIWTCPYGIISVRKQYCNRFGKECNLMLPAGEYQNLMKTIDKADVQACFDDEDHYCALELDDLGKPWCYLENSGTNFYEGPDDSFEEYGGPVIVPSIDKGAYYECPMEGQPQKQSYVLVHSTCIVSCDCYCFPRDDCDLTCGQDGFTESFAFEFATQTGWDTESGEADLEEIQASYSPFDEEYANANLQPARSFPEWGTEFEYNFLVNKVFPTAAMQGEEEPLEYAPYLTFYGDPDYEVALRIASVQGCTIEDDAMYEYTNEQGVYEVSIVNNPNIGTGQDLWSGAATVAHINKNEYLGVQCRKPDDKWGEVELCAPVYTDYSSLYGSCVNSLYQHDPSILDYFYGDGYTYLGRVATASLNDQNKHYGQKGCAITDGGFIACLTMSEKIDQSATIDGWQQEFAFSDPVGELSTKKIEWPTTGWETAALYGYIVLQGASVASSFGAASGLFSLTGSSLWGNLGIGAGAGALGGFLKYAVADEKCSDNLWSSLAAGTVIGTARGAARYGLTQASEGMGFPGTEAEPGIILPVVGEIGGTPAVPYSLTLGKAAFGAAGAAVDGGLGLIEYSWLSHINDKGCYPCNEQEVAAEDNAVGKVWGCNEKNTDTWFVTSSNESPN